MIETELYIFDWRALDKRVLVVACVTKFPDGGGDWAAYIGAVAGTRHSDEWEEVRAYGSKLYEGFAALLFPEFAKKYRWRS